MRFWWRLGRVAIAGLGSGGGGPKRQSAPGWRLSPMPPQSVSAVQLTCGLTPVQGPPVPQNVPAAKHVAPGVGPPTHVPAFTHSFAGPDALVQSIPPQLPNGQPALVVQLMPWLVPP